MRKPKQPCRKPPVKAGGHLAPGQRPAPTTGHASEVAADLPTTLRLQKTLWSTHKIMSGNKGLLLEATTFQGHSTSSARLGELPAQLKASGCLGVQKSGEMNPGRQEQVYSPGMFVQTELRPQRVLFLEHSSTSKQKNSLSQKDEGC